MSEKSCYHPSTGQDLKVHEIKKSNVGPVHFGKWNINSLLFVLPNLFWLVLNRIQKLRQGKFQPNLQNEKIRLQWLWSLFLILQEQIIENRILVQEYRLSLLRMKEDQRNLDWIIYHLLILILVNYLKLHHKILTFSLWNLHRTKVFLKFWAF